MGCFNLPVGSGKTPHPYHHSLPANVGILLPLGENKPAKIAAMIVSMITPQNGVQVMLLVATVGHVPTQTHTLGAASIHLFAKGLFKDSGGKYVTVCALCTVLP